jgi:hypothetical protein
MLLYLIKQHEFLASVADHFDYLKEFLEYMRARSRSEDPWALKGTVFLPS